VCHVKVLRSACRRRDDIPKAHPCSTTTYVCCNAQDGLINNCNVTTSYKDDDEDDLCYSCGQLVIKDALRNHIKTDYAAQAAQNRALQQQNWEQTRELLVRVKEIQALQREQKDVVGGKGFECARDISGEYPCRGDYADLYRYCVV